MRQQNDDDGGSRSTLDVIDRVVRPTERDPLLSETNVGLGNYDKGLYWQQIEDFRNHLYGEAAFGGGKNLSRAISDVKHALAAEKWDGMTESEREAALADLTDSDDRPGSRRRWFEVAGENLFEARVEPDPQDFGGSLTPDERELLRLQEILNLTDEYLNVDGELRTAMARMLIMKHEGSRSIDAHLIDSVTGRTKEFHHEGDAPKRSRRGRGGRR